MSYKDLSVLIVDDFATMRRIVRNIVRELDFKEIVEAQDGRDAVGVLESRKIDLILSDWNMPNMNGLELLKWVRSNETTRDVFFLMITAEGQPDNVVEAVKAKVNNYIIKPFTAATLAEKLQKVIPKERQG